MTNVSFTDSIFHFMDRGNRKVKEVKKNIPFVNNTNSPKRTIFCEVEQDTESTEFDPIGNEEAELWEYELARARRLAGRAPSAADYQIQESKLDKSAEDRFAATLQKAYRPTVITEGLSFTALRDNSDKPRLSEVFKFGAGLKALARVMSQGALKYDEDNWLKGGKPDNEYLDAASRHLECYINGEFYDQDVGTAHLAHVAWNALACLRLNHNLMPDLDPDFDQETFVEKYNKDTYDF